MISCVRILQAESDAVIPCVRILYAESDAMILSVLIPAEELGSEDDVFPRHLQIFVYYSGKRVSEW